MWWRRRRRRRREGACGAALALVAGLVHRGISQARAAGAPQVVGMSAAAEVIIDVVHGAKRAAGMELAAPLACLVRRPLREWRSHVGRAHPVSVAWPRGGACVARSRAVDAPLIGRLHFPAHWTFAFPRVAYSVCVCACLGEGERPPRASTRPAHGAQAMSMSGFEQAEPQAELKRLLAALDPSCARAYVRACACAFIVWALIRHLRLLLHGCAFRRVCTGVRARGGGAGTRS